MAAAQALTDQFIKVRADSDRSIETKDLSVLHSTLMQNVIHGYDILPSAVHLTASTLALLAPEIAFRQMNLFVMPIGMDHGKARLGSLDFLASDKIQIQFALDNTHLDTVQTGAAGSVFANARVPKLDLCVMNPPFVTAATGTGSSGRCLKTGRSSKRSFRSKHGSSRLAQPLGLALFSCRWRTGTSSREGVSPLCSPSPSRRERRGARLGRF